MLSYSIEICDLYSPSSSPSPSHQLEFALQVKSDEKLAMSEGSSGLEGQTMADAVLSSGVLNVGLIEGKEICGGLGFGLSPVVQLAEFGLGYVP